MSRLDVLALSQKHFLLYGGTGFLGKVFLSLLLTHFPDLGGIYLVVRARRDRKGNIKTSSESRFLQDIVTSQALDPVRAKHPGSAFMKFINEKITVVDGDVTRPFAGITDDIRDQIRGKVNVLINTSGVVDFNPPLDKSLEVNAFGMQNLMLARDLGDIPFMHTSTCYVAGDQTGQSKRSILTAFPGARSPLGRALGLEREIRECMK